MISIDNTRTLLLLFLGYEMKNNLAYIPHVFQMC